ncbi:unnamed protein product [Closterium sp. NIES-54]
MSTKSAFVPIRWWEQPLSSSTAIGFACTAAATAWKSSPTSGASESVGSTTPTIEHDASPSPRPLPTPAVDHHLHGPCPASTSSRRRPSLTAHLRYHLHPASRDALAVDSASSVQCGLPEEGAPSAVRPPASPRPEGCSWRATSTIDVGTRAACSRRRPLHSRLTPVDATFDFDHSSLLRAIVAADSCTTIDLVVDATFVSHQWRRNRKGRVFRRPLRPDAQLSVHPGDRHVLAILMAFPCMSQTRLQGTTIAAVAAAATQAGTLSGNEGPVMQRQHPHRQHLQHQYLQHQHLEPEPLVPVPPPAATLEPVPPIPTPPKVAPLVPAPRASEPLEQ